MERKKLQDRYVEFMGSWMAGTVVGHFLGKIIAAGLIIYFIYSVMK